LGDQIALLFGGRLAQVGTPSDFYERPHTAAIARFFGGVNFLAGQGDGHQFWVEQWPQPLAVATPHPHARQLTIRPEHIQLATAATAPETNTVQGHITRTLYAGTHTRLQAAVAGQTLELLVWGQTDLAVGSAVSLYLPPEKLWGLDRV
jgi:ABC-type sugar transport system ATPase subunit